MILRTPAELIDEAIRHARDASLAINHHNEDAARLDSLMAIVKGLAAVAVAIEEAAEKLSGGSR